MYIGDRPRPICIYIGLGDRPIQRRNGIWGFHSCNVWNEMPGA